jgi:hypothetical protein
MADGGDSAGLTFRDAFGGGDSRDSADEGSDDFESESSGDSPQPDHRRATAASAQPTAAAAAAPAARGRSDAASGLVEAALASGQWQKVSDPSSGKFYFYNVTTRKTTWDLAKELMPSDEPPPVVADDSSDGSGGLPQLQLGGSFAGSSATGGGFGGLPGADESLTAMPARGMGLPGAERRVSVKAPSAMSGGSDEFEDDVTAKEKIVRRGGRVPVSSSYPASGDLFNSVSGYKAFASESDRGDSPAQTKGAAGSRQASAAALGTSDGDLGTTMRPSEAVVTAPPAAVKLPESRPSVAGPDQSDSSRDTRQPVAAAEPTVSKAAAKAPEQRRRIFDSDSDFSTVSQTVAKLQEQPKAEAVAEPKPVTGPVASTQPKQSTQSAIPVSSSQPPVGSKPTAVPQASTSQAFASQATGAAAGPSSAAGHTDHAPIQYAVQYAPMPGQPRSELQGQSEALESLVRAYAQLRSRNSGADEHRVNERIAAAVRAALDDEEGSDGQALPSTRGRVAHLLQRQEVARLQPSRTWGNVNPSKRGARPARGEGRGSANAIVANEQLDDTILDVVLGLFMEHAGGGGTPEVAAARRRHADPVDVEDAALLGTLPATVGGAPRTHPHVRTPFSSTLLSVDFGGDEPIKDVVGRALDRYVLQAVRQAGRADVNTARGLGAAFRVALRDVADAIQTAACTVLGKGGSVSEPFPAGSVVLTVELSHDEMFDASVAKVLQCVPVDKLTVPEQDGDERLPRQQYALEYWLTPAHAWDVVAALNATSRRIEVVLADGYGTFEGGGGNSRAALSAAAPAIPEGPVVSVHMRESRSTSSRDVHPKPSAGTVRGRGVPETEFLQDEDAASVVFFAAGTLADEVEAVVMAERKNAQHAAASPESLAGARMALTLRTNTEIAVASTVSDLLKDPEIRGAVKRRSTAKALEELSKDVNVSRLDAAQDRVNRIVEQLRYQVQGE